MNSRGGWLVTPREGGLGVFLLVEVVVNRGGTGVDDVPDGTGEVVSVGASVGECVVEDFIDE